MLSLVGPKLLASTLVVATSVGPKLRQNHLSSKGIISLAEGLRSNKGVKTLNLMNQQLGGSVGVFRVLLQQTREFHI